MRKSLVAAVALAPLCFAVSQAPVVAQDNVTNGVSTPIATATASNGAPADIDIASGGSVTVNTATSGASLTAAVTLNSAGNQVTNAGSISLTGVNNTNSAGIYATTGLSISNSGTITNTENYTPTTNGDGLANAPFASPTNTGPTAQRYGIFVTGSGLTGALVNTGSITVQGNNSYGIYVSAPVQGGIAQAGTITYTGDNGAGFYTSPLGVVSGGSGTGAGSYAIPSGIQLSGSITATGQNSSAVSINGAVNGAVTVYSSITATGYSTTTRTTSDSALQTIENSTNAPLQLQQSAAAMIVNSNVTGGIFIGAPPVNTVSTQASTIDLDGDGISDISEGTGAINIYGSAPGLLIGGSNPITIGNFGTTTSEPSSFTQPANAYGLIVRGSINAYGTYDGVSATAVQVGGQGGTVNLSGGIRSVGSINASSYDANATAVSIGAGATLNEIRNEDFIDSTVSHSTIALTTPLVYPFNAATSASNPQPSEPVVAAYGILIGQGATVNQLTNIGTLSAAATGDRASAIAVQDNSGSLSYVFNEGVISAQIAAGVTGDQTFGATTALDLSHNTTGVTLLQEVNTNPISVYVSTTTSSSGTTTTTASTTGTVTGSTVNTKVTTTSSTVTTTVTTTSAGVTTTTISTTPTVPEIIGDVLLGTGANNVQLLGGSITGALDLGGSTSGSQEAQFTIDNGATYNGALTYEGSHLVLNVNNGILVNTSATTLKLDSFKVGSSGVVYFAIDPAHSANTLFQVSGAVTLATGSGFGVDLLTVVPTTQTYTIVAANPGAISSSVSSSALLVDVPYLVNASATTNASAGTISVTVTPKTAAQLGLNAGQSAALGPITQSLANDPAIEAALLDTYTKSSFLNIYNQLLPDYSGGVFQLAAAGSDAITRATSRTNDIENPAGTRGAWAQEFAFGVNRAALGATGYRGEGFGFVGGLETGGAGYGAFGLTSAFMAGTLSDPHAPGINQQSFSEGEIGGYWQGQFKGFRADARVAGGYLQYTDLRELYQADSSGTITLDRNAKGSTQGWSATGHFGAAYQFDLGRWFIRPSAGGDYFRLYEGGFKEHGGADDTGGDGFDLALASRTGYQATGLASLTIGRTIGTSFLWRPQVQVGYRDAFAGTAGNTTAQFVSGGSSFTMVPVNIKGGGPMARFGAKADTDFYELDFEAGAEERNNFYSADLRFNVRVLF
jgi:hypothetical protein